MSLAEDTVTLARERLNPLCQGSSGIESDSTGRVGKGAGSEVKETRNRGGITGYGYGGLS